MTSESQSRVKWLRIAAVLLVPGLLVIVETGLQIRETLKPPAAGTAFWTEPDSLLGYRLKRDHHTIDGLAYINYDGIRGDSRHLASETGYPRILVVGNSCAFGAGIADTGIFTYLLEQSLREDGHESAIVFNAGVGGYNSNQVLAYLERDLWRFRPTHLVVYCGWNDIVVSTWPFYVPEVQMGPDRREPPGLLARLLGFVEKSRLFWSLRSRARGLALRWTRADGGRDVWNERYIIEYRAHLDAIAASADRRGVPVAFALLQYDSGRYPVRYSTDAFHYTREGFHRLWTRFQSEIAGAADGHDLLDFPAAIRGREADTDVIYDYNHLGHEGHRIIARYLKSRLTREESPIP
jgi:hypothetical protein